MINDLPGAYKARNIMQAMWKGDTYHHEWIRDDGTYVKCPVMVQEKTRIESGEYRFTHIANINKPSTEGLSIPANFVQSIDALICARMIKTAHEQGYELYTVHDSFFSHCNYMQQTRENYKNILIDLAKKPILLDWIKQMSKMDLIHTTQPEVDNFVNLLESMEYMLS